MTLHAQPSLFAMLLALGISITSSSPDAKERDPRWDAFEQPGWEMGRQPIAEEEIAVIMALKQRNLPFLEERARAVSDPSSSDYGQYMSHAEVTLLTGPSDQHIAVVEEFLRLAGVSYRFSKAKDFAALICSVACIERLFNTTLLHQHGHQSPPISRIRAYTPILLPERVASALDGVSLNAPIFMPRKPQETVGQPFIFPASGRTEPRIDPFIVAGDGLLKLNFVAYCKDGEANRDSLEEGICSSSGHTITSFEALVIQEENMVKVVDLPVSRSLLGQKQVKCSGEVTCTLFNTTIGSIGNYLGTRVVLRAFFDDGSATSFSNETEVRSTWPVPYTTPGFLSRFYNMLPNLPIKHPRNAISVAEFLGQYFNPADLDSFFRVMGIRTWPQTQQPVTLGPDLPLTGSVLGGEAQLDIQYIMAMASNVSTWFWSVPGKELATTQEPFLHWLMQVADHDETTAPLVHSVSYSDDESTMPLWFQKRADVEFMKLAVRGVSVLVASGDDGASGYRTRGGHMEFCNLPRPGFPSTSPWVTAVGGTQLSKMASPVCGYTSEKTTVNCKEAAEVVCSSDRGGVITSGGGFSNNFARPWYQEDAIDGYLAQSDSPVPHENDSYQFNRSGRGYPDISAIANNYLIWMKGGLEATSGTSASTPLIAAMVAHWNEVRLQNGQPPLGFLNPFLYSLAQTHPEAFNDVIVGDNRCGLAACCEKGFGAARGWDATTGIGSPRFDVVTELVRAGIGRKGAPLGSSLSTCTGTEAMPNVSSWAVSPLLIGLLLGAAAMAISCGMVHRRGKGVNRPVLSACLLDSHREVRSAC